MIMTSHPNYTSTVAPAGELRYLSPGGSSGAHKSVVVIAVFVLASLCAVLGAIYAYIYYYRIHPRPSSKPSKHIEPIPQEDDQGANPTVNTHLFLFKKS